MMTLPMGTIVARQVTTAGDSRGGLGKVEILQADAHVAFSVELLENLDPRFARFDKASQVVTFKGVNRTVRYRIERWEGERTEVEGGRFAVATRIEDAA